MTERKFCSIYNFIFLVCTLVATTIFMFAPLPKYVTKSTASAVFVICGLMNFILTKKYFENVKFKFNLFLLIGLIFAMAGDIFLIDNFVLGAILFAVGHIFYFVSFLFLQKFNYKDILIGLCIFGCVLLIIFLYPNFNFDGMLILILVYALIISLMLGKSVSNCIFSYSFANLYILIGTFLFFFSDAMLLFYVFGPHTLVFDILCVFTYYPGQFMLASSMFVNCCS